MDNTYSIYQFGKELISTLDLDPVYVVIHHAQLSRKTLEKWLLAYWCFYHVGTASFISSREDCKYWEAFRDAADSKLFPRSSERRHFRGLQAKRSVAYLEEQGIDRLFHSFQGEMTVEEVMEIVQRWVGFGPWIAFKVADMLETLGLVKVRFNEGAMFLFDSPREGAERLWREHYETEPEEKAGTWAVERILNQLGTTLAPPSSQRSINVQEAETILCKWNSYRKGHYHLGEDIQAVRNGLLRFPRVPLCQHLLKAGRQGKLWE